LDSVHIPTKLLRDGLSETFKSQSGSVKLIPILVNGYSDVIYLNEAPFNFAAPETARISNVHLKSINVKVSIMGKNLKLITQSIAEVKVSRKM